MEYSRKICIGTVEEMYMPPDIDIDDDIITMYGNADIVIGNVGTADIVLGRLV